MPDITANAPDGTKHIFPDGTDPAVIDRVMKQYITGSAQPSTPQQPGTGRPDEPGAYQTRRGGPILNANNSPLREGALAAERSLGISNPTSAVDALKQAGGSAWDFLKKSAGEPFEGMTAMDALDPVNVGVRTAAVVPNVVARGVEGIAGGIESGGKDLYQGLQRGDTRSAAAGMGTLLATRAMTPMDEGLKANVTEAGKAIQRHLAIDQGKVRVVNDMVRQPLARLDAAVTNEIGKSVQQAVQADEMDMQTKGTKTGMVDVSKASAAARDKIGQTAKEVSNLGDTLITRGESQPMMNLRDAKSYTTDVGRAAAAARRAGNLREATALDSLYDGLHSATKDRATDLGQGKIWQHYIDETRNYKNMQGGLLGELTDEPIHAKALNKLTDPARATEAAEISKALDKYGIDPAQFDKAKSLGVDLNRYSQETKANFMGKIKAIVKHPMLAGGATIGASAVGSASGIPVMGLVLPIIVAGKVANMLDASSLKGLLADIQKETGPTSGQVNAPLEGPMKGGAEPPRNVPRGTPPSGNRRAAVRDEVNRGILDQLHGELRKATAPEDKARIQRNINDLKEQGVTAEADIAGMLKDQFKFTDNAAKQLVSSIRGKYQGLDEGLKMAMAEAIKRTKGAKK